MQEEKQQAERKELMKGIKKKERKEIKMKGKKATAEGGGST